MAHRLRAVQRLALFSVLFLDRQKPRNAFAHFASGAVAWKMTQTPQTDSRGP